MKTKEKSVTDNTNKIKIENMVLKEENNKNKNEILNLKRQKEENELEKNKYINEINDLQNEINVLNEKFKQDKGKINEYINLNKNLNDEINKYKGENERLNNQVKRLANKKPIIQEPNKINYDKIKLDKVTSEKQDLEAQLGEKDLIINKNNKLINELNDRINNLLRQNKDKEESIKKISTEKENENKLLKERIKLKDESINNLNEKIRSLSKTQIIEHRTIVEDEEFNSLVDENEELKAINKELVEKLNYLMKQRKETNYYQSESVINQQKEEINSLNIKYNQLYYELNQYKDKNYELNRQIRNLKNGMK